MWVVLLRTGMRPTEGVSTVIRRGWPIEDRGKTTCRSDEMCRLSLRLINTVDDMSETVTCPRCGSIVPALSPIETGFRLQIQEMTEEGQLPDMVCTKCIGELKRATSHGAKLRAHAKAKEDQRNQLWVGRVNLIKAARQQMSAKKYSEAAVSYEKYIRSLEIVFECKPGELTPEHFRAKAHQKELTVLASSLWDLVCIYDTSPRYGSRMAKACDKLMEFARFTPVYASIVRKAQSMERKANNPAVIRKFLKAADSRRAFCFIAQAVFDDSPDPDLQTLVNFRRHGLEPSWLGRQFVAMYYRLSPWWAQQLMGPLAAFRRPVRCLLQTLARSRWMRPFRPYPEGGRDRAPEPGGQTARADQHLGHSQDQGMEGMR